MTKVVVTEKALREMVQEAMFNKDFSGWSSNIEGPAEVNPVTDPSAPVTDPINPNFMPQTKTEFGIAVNQLVKNLPDTQMPGLFDTVKMAIDQKEDKDEEEKEMDKKIAAAGTGVDEGVRRVVRNILADINPRWDATKTLAEARPQKEFGPVVGPRPPVTKVPAGVHGGEYNRKREKYQGDLKKLLKSPNLDVPEREPTLDDFEDVPDPTDEPAGEAPAPKARTHKATAIGGMEDVDYDLDKGQTKPKSFEEIAGELSDDLKAQAEAELADAADYGDDEEFDKTKAAWDEPGAKTAAVSGAKRIADEALKKYEYIAKMDEDDLKALIKQSAEDYVQYLARSGELSSADIQLMHDHLEKVVYGLSGFREFLQNAIRRERQIDQGTNNPSSKPADWAEDEPTGEETGASTAVTPLAGAKPDAGAKRSKDSYKVYPWRGKRSVVRVGGKLYGTGEGGAVGDGATTQFKGGDRANVARDGDKLKVSKTDSDHSQTWDPVEEAKRPVLHLKRK